MSNQLDLFYLRNKNDYGENFGLNQLNEELNKKYDKMFNDINQINIKQTVAKGFWDEERKLVRIYDDKHQTLYVPRVMENFKWLTPFEALFLLECKSISLFFKNISLSIEDAYELLLNDKHDFKLYKIFSTFSRIGYYVDQINNDLIKNFKLSKTQTDQSDNQLKLTVKRPSSDIDCEEKKLQPKRINLTEEKFIENYHIINNVRPLELSNIPKMNKIDNELIKYFEPKTKTSNSYLYCLKKSSRIVNTPALLSPLYGHKLQPIIPLGTICRTDKLFETMQTENPINIFLDSSISSVNKQNNKISIDFTIYKSRKQWKNSERPLMAVAIVEQDQCLPSIEEIEQLLINANINAEKFLFALISPTLNFSFYCIENLNLPNKYPRLWEKEYSNKKEFQN